METRNVLDIKQYILLSYDDSISFTMTQNESPSTIAAQPYFHQLAPQSLLHSAKSSCLSGALGSLNKPLLCYLGARIAFVQHRLIIQLLPQSNIRRLALLVNAPLLLKGRQHFNLKPMLFAQTRPQNLACLILIVQRKSRITHARSPVLLLPASYWVANLKLPTRSMLLLR